MTFSPSCRGAPTLPVTKRVFPRLGNGIYPGAFDTMFADDLDGDGKTEVVFGNFDGFVEILEQRLVTIDVGNQQRILVPEHRSKALGYGISALDVGVLAGGQKTIVFASSNGYLWKIQCTGTAGQYTPVVPFSPSGSPVQVSDGLVNWLVIGDFSAGMPGKEVLIQTEDDEIILYNYTGTEMARLDRWVPDPNSTLPENYAVTSGKPAVLYWPLWWPNEFRTGNLVTGSMLSRRFVAG